MELPLAADVQVDWVRLPSGLVVLATSERAWAYHPTTPDEWLLLPRPPDGTVPPSLGRQLLDGVIGAAHLGRPRGVARPPMTALRWVWWLATSYWTTHVTPSLMAEAARRFAAAGRRELAEWAADKAREEAGHDALALRDLAALGYPPGQVVEVLASPAARALTDYFSSLVLDEDGPLGCVGYSYALERLALLNDERTLAAVRAILPAGVNATRCLHVHSACGSDVRHVEETVQLVAGLPAPERARIAQACFESARLCRAVTENEPPEEVLGGLLAEVHHRSRQEAAHVGTRVHTSRPHDGGAGPESLPLEAARSQSLEQPGRPQAPPGQPE